MKIVHRDNPTRVGDYDKIQPIVEVYTAVQSEGSRAGFPTVVIRTTGCTHRCFFGEGGWCDSPYTSINPEKGGYSITHILDIYDKNPHIKEMMLTGGSPTMHPKLVNELTYIAAELGIFITMETEGSKFIKTDYPIHLISLSPKFSNSTPMLYEPTPNGGVTTQRMIDQHEKSRLNVPEIIKILRNQEDNGLDYHIKPVWDGKDQKVLQEILEFVKFIDPSKVWFMPAGDSRESLFISYPLVFDWVRDNGYRMTWRPHIIAFEDQREV